MDVREAELIGDAGDGLAQLVREGDLVVVCELRLPEFAVLNALRV